MTTVYGSAERYLLGADMLQKLNCPRSMLITSNNNEIYHGVIGKAFIDLTHGSRCLTRMFDVVDTLRGLHLDETTISELQCQPDEVLGAESHLVLDHHIFTPEGWVKVSALSHPKMIMITWGKATLQLQPNTSTL